MIPAIALISAISQLAPSVVSLFKGGEKTQEVAEIAASVARQVTGTSTNDQALEVLKANPEKLGEYANALEQHAADFEQAVIKDRQDARERDIELRKLGQHNYRADFLVATTILVIFVIIGIVVLNSSLDEFAKGALTTILGVFLNQLISIFQFEFGTTRKSEDSQSKIVNEYLKS